jgi:phage head maturation protease
MKRERPPVLYREMAFDRAAIDEANRTATLSFSSEAPVVRSSWLFGQWTEILRHESQAVDLARMNSIGVLLYQHDIRTPIGGILRAWLDEPRRKCMAEVRFDADPQSDGVFQKVLSGTLRGVSVGYRVLEDDWEVVKDGKKSNCGRFTGPCEIANRWTPYEGSIVSIPADATVGVGRGFGLDSEMTEYMFSRMANVVAERIIKNIPFAMPPAPEVNPPNEEQEREPDQPGPPPKLKVLRRKLELISA